MELDAVVRRVREEFREMPGLRLTPAQATRLWGLEHEICRAVIERLVASAFLRWTPAGAITRAEGERPRGDSSYDDGRAGLRQVNT